MITPGDTDTDRVSRGGGVSEHGPNSMDLRGLRDSFDVYEGSWILGWACSGAGPGRRHNDDEEALLLSPSEDPGACLERSDGVGRLAYMHIVSPLCTVIAGLG